METEDHNSKHITNKHFIGLPVSIVLLVGILAILGPDITHWLRYDRQAILNGELWRLITGHIVHLGWKHSLMNIIGLTLIWILFGRLLKLSNWLLIIFISALGISLGFLVFNPDLSWYVGLSGVLHAMFVAGAVASVYSGHRAEMLLLALITAKLIWEQLQGALPGSEEFAGGNVVVEAHL